MRILEEFWYGNIVPTEYKKLLELICRNEEKLHAAMTNEQKELFEKYTDCVWVADHHRLLDLPEQL